MKYKIIRTSRKTTQLSIDDSLEIVVRTGLFEPEWRIDRFVRENEQWIEKHIAMKKLQIEKDRKAEQNSDELRADAREYLAKRTGYWEAVTGLKCTGIKITSAKHRFGSCSCRNSICYSYRLMQYPEEAIDYVILHELCHIRYKNHGASFYRLIEKYMPDYKNRIKLLK